MSSDLTTINITKCPESYDELVERISNIVQLMINFDPKAELPNRIIMTKKQQKMLRRYKMMHQMYGTTRKLWLTPHNVMEVVVA